MAPLIFLQKYGIYDSHMHRTMVYLEEQDYQMLIKRAASLGRPFSELIRESIRRYLAEVVKCPAWEEDTLWRLNGAGKGNVSNTDSRDHDKILYGLKK